MRLRAAALRVTNARAMSAEEQRQQSGLWIDRLRRPRSSCLYCSDVVLTREHPLPAAMGGRLFSLMLCERHRVEITRVTDEPAIENFKPLTMFLAVPRQDGKVGAAFRATTDDGKPVVVLPDGRVPGPRLVVQERANDGRIKRATGSLSELDSLKKQGAFVRTGTEHVLAYSEKAPIVNFGVNADENLAGFILKVALHFFAAFVADPDAGRASEILEYVLGGNKATFKYVSTPIISSQLFADAWPPRHEITVYPRDQETWVSVLFFNAYGYIVKLPLPCSITQPLRYTQPLLGRPNPLLYETSDDGIDWEYKASQAEIKAWLEEVHKRLDRIQEYCEKRILRSQCFRAARAAKRETSKPGDQIGFWGHYREQLRLEAFDAQVVDRLVSVGMENRDKGSDIWEV
jgi:hypothetical protein